MSASDYFGEYWSAISSSQFGEATAKHNQILYLKDWHFQLLYPDYHAYTVPDCFTSDWLNEYCLDQTDSDYRFVYLGPQHSWTPFHCDVFGSYSWSANIAGRKLWILLPPGEEKKLLCRNRLPWDLGECSSETLSSLSGIRLLQEPGDVLFVPSGWHHQVANLEACISINHNWFNACNARHCHDRLLLDLTDVLQSLSDVRDTPGFDEAAQSLLLAHSGLNIPKWFDLLSFIFRRRLNQWIGKAKATKVVQNWLVAHDLVVASDLLNELISDSTNQVAACLPKDRCEGIQELLNLPLTFDALSAAKLLLVFLD
uniref:Jumonji domain-containing protein 4 n=1 Tax=Macrostomum lignano TaxID=282301 RepID=A0A1I8INX9_9PLAT